MIHCSRTIVSLRDDPAPIVMRVDDRSIIVPEVDDL
jgi:hypothetical protein